METFDYLQLGEEKFVYVYETSNVTSHHTATLMRSALLCLDKGGSLRVVPAVEFKFSSEMV